MRSLRKRQSLVAEGAGRAGQLLERSKDLEKNLHGRRNIYSVQK
jgi:hypothetical protein